MNNLLILFIMPRKLENGKYAFKGGCIGEKGKDGKYKLVAVRKNKIKKGKKSKKSTKSKVENEGENKVENKVENKKKRRSQKKRLKNQHKKVATIQTWI